jgi:4-hydroxy-2-oxoheptanedioate aldolase
VNSFRKALRRAPQLGFVLTYPAPGIVELVAPDWDWIWVDGQHGEMGYRELLEGVRAAQAMKRPALVRVPGHDAGAIGLALDMGADAIMVPCVDSVDQARAVVRAAKFPPLGNRSFGGRRPVDLGGIGYCHSDGPLLVCQVETPESFAAVDEIAALDGVDALFLGADDLTLRRGLRMDKPRPAGAVDDALKGVARAAKKHGKIAGAIFTTPESLRLGVKLGYRLMGCSLDALFIGPCSKEKSRALRSALR